jgi:hypothetical protein
MIRGHQLAISELVKASPQTTQWLAAAKQELRCRPTQAHDHFRNDDFELPGKKLTANQSLPFLRHAIGWGATLDNIADVHIRALQAHRSDDSIQQLSCCSNERAPCPILVSARTFANENQTSLGMTFTKNELAATSMQGTTRAFSYLFSQCGQEGLV